VLRSNDDGATWARIPLEQDVEFDATVRCLAVHPREPHVVHGGADVGLARSEDAGVTWRRVPSPFDGQQVWSIAVDPRDPDSMLVGTGAPSRAAVYRTQDAGVSWQRMSPELPERCAGVSRPRILTATWDEVDGKSAWFGVEEGGLWRTRDRGGSYVRFAPHLSWRDEPLRDAMRDRLGVPVTVDNDANAALWAEVRFGAARGETDVLCVNLGTGIGGALLVAGRLHRGAFGMAGEFGHMQVVPGGRACECGRTGCWEQYASGNVIARAARVMAKAGEAGSALLTRAGGDATRVTGLVVTEAAMAGDPTARRLLGEVGEWLGVGLANLVAAFDPALVIVGGGLSEAGELLLTPAREAFAQTLPGRDYRPLPRIVAASLGNNAGLVGAADLARRALDPKPGVGSA
jgi:glucokinase